MELKRAPHQMKANTVNREDYSIEFVLSTGSVDRHEERIDQAGWRLENYKKNPVVLWGHDQRQLPIGRCEDIRVENDQLIAKVIFAYEQNPMAAIVFELCADKFLNAGSVGFMNLKWMYDEEEDLLTLLENELYEFSIVNVPANPEALAKEISALEERGASKRVIDGVKQLRKEAQDRLDDRFKDLGDEVKEEDAPADTGADDAAADDEPAADTEAEPTDDDVKGSVDEIFIKSKEKFELEPVMKALEVLMRAPAGKIQAAVQELISDSEDADIKGTMVDKPTPAPQGRKRRTYDVNEVNRVLRLLKTGKK